MELHLRHGGKCDLIVVFSHLRCQGANCARLNDGVMVCLSVKETKGKNERVWKPAVPSSDSVLRWMLGRKAKYRSGGEAATVGHGRARARFFKKRKTSFLLLWRPQMKKKRRRGDEKEADTTSTHQGRIREMVVRLGKIADGRPIDDDPPPAALNPGTSHPLTRAWHTDNMPDATPLHLSQRPVPVHIWHSIAGAGTRPVAGRGPAQSRWIEPESLGHLPPWPSVSCLAPAARWR